MTFMCSAILYGYLQAANAGLGEDRNSEMRRRLPFVNFALFVIGIAFPLAGRARQHLKQPPGDNLSCRRSRNSQITGPPENTGTS